MVRLTQSERYAALALLAILTGCTLPPGGHEHRPEVGCDCGWQANFGCNGSQSDSTVSCQRHRASARFAGDPDHFARVLPSPGRHGSRSAKSQ